MTNTTSADLAPFFERYDRRLRLLLAAAVCASLVLSAVIFTHGLDTLGTPGAVLAVQGFPIVFYPLFTAGWWLAMEMIARWRDRRPVASGDDARNGLRLANAGFVFNVGLMAAGLSQQGLMTLSTLGYPAGPWVGRVSCMAVGLVTIYLGNVWPNMPTPRVLDPKAANVMRINRLWGWAMVILGVGIVLLGLFLPLLYPLLHGPRG